MKKNIGIGLLITFNIAFVLFIILMTYFIYGFMGGSVGRINADRVTKEKFIEIFTYVLCFSVLNLAINFLILKFLVANKRAIRNSIIILLSSLVVYLPFLAMETQNTYTRHNSTDTLGQRLVDKETIDVLIITASDTLIIQQEVHFTPVFYQAARVDPVLKYKKTMKIIYRYKDGSADTIPTNGQTFGPYHNMFFEAERNVVEEYLKIYNR